MKYEAAQSTTRGPWGWWLLGLALVLVFLTRTEPIQGFDIFYHLATGDWILENRTVPRTGLFSATQGDAAWVDNEWGFQVLVAVAHRMGGWVAQVLLASVLTTLALSLLAVCMLRRGLTPAAVAVGVWLASFALGDLVLRPQLVTYVFVAAFLVGTFDLIDGRGRAPLLYLPILAVLWANLHAGFIIGLVVLAIPAAVESLRRLSRRPEVAPLSLLLATLGLCLAGCFLNPYGWRQVYYPIEYLVRPGMTRLNLEWLPTVLSNEPGFLLLTAVSVIVIGLLPRRVFLHEALLLTAFFAFALKATRHVGLAAFVLPAAAAPAFADLLRRGSERFSLKWQPVHGVFMTAVLVIAFLAIGDLPRRASFRFDYENILLPERATDFLLKHDTPGRLFNQYGWGGYLMHRFGRDEVVFVDGRNDLYPEEFMADYQRVISGAPDALEILDRHGVGTALLAYHPNNAALLRLLLGDGWVCVHVSTETFVPTVVLVRDSPDARPLIEERGIPLRPPPTRR